MNAHERGESPAGEFEPDRQLIELLVAYDTKLSGGFASTRDDPLDEPAGVSAEMLAYFEEAKESIRCLERLWPRAAHREEAVPPTIGRFQLVREVGRGGFGIVYLARDVELDRQVALKLQRPEALLSPALRRRFLREAQTAARLEHPRIATVYDVGESELRIWIASEYVKGGSLAAWLRHNPRPVDPPSAARFVAELAEALDHAHRQGVLHRDIKPSNVLLQTTVDKEAARADNLDDFAPKLIDFGLARLDQASRAETRTGVLVGTPRYMAPEQATGNVRAIGPATDVYGLGAVLYELITARPAFAAETDIAVLRQVVDTEPSRPRALLPGIPADLEAICLKCLEKSPAARYATAAGLADDLRRYLAGQPTVARPLGKLRRAIRWARRRPAWASLLAISVLGTLVMAAGNVAYIRALQRAGHSIEQSRNAAQQSASAARVEQERANQFLYASRMRLAYELLGRGSVSQADELVRHYEPPSAEAHRRGFEWYHLRRNLHPERLSLAGHRGEIYSVAYAPDGRLLASAGQDGHIRLWRPSDGREVATLKGHTSCVNQTAFARDGKTLISVSCDRSIKLWDVDSHALLATLQKHSGEVQCLAVSPDGRRFVTGGRGGQIILWDLATRDVLQSTEGIGADVQFVAWRDDLHVIFPDAEWNVETGERRPLDGHGPTADLAWCVATSTAGDIVLGMGDGAVRLLNEQAAHTTSVATHGYAVRAIDLLPERNWLAAGYDDATVQIVSWPQGGFRANLASHTARVQSVAFSPAGDELASASFDGTVKLWDFDFESLPRLSSPVYTPRRGDLVFALSVGLEYLAVPTHADRVTLFDVGSARPIGVLPLSSRVLALAFSAEEPDCLLGCSMDTRQVWKWNWKEDRLEELGALPPGEPRTAIFSPDGRHLLTHSRGGPATIARTRGGQTWWREEVSPADHGVNVAKFSPSAETAFVSIGSATDLARRRYYSFDLRAERLIGPEKDNVLAISDTHVARMISQDLIAVETTGGREVCRIVPPPFAAWFTFAPDGRTLATMDVNQASHVWQFNVATGQLVSQFPVMNAQHAQLRYSADGRRLAAFTLSETNAVDNGFRHQGNLYVWSGSDEP